MDDFENGIDDINAFEKKLKTQKGTILESSNSSSSDEELDSVPISSYSNENTKLQTKVKLLIQQLIDKDREIESLRSVLGYGKPEPEESEFSGDFREQKLMELAKKLRTMQVALESEKNRAARAMEEVNRLREEALKKENTKGWSRNLVKPEPEKPNFEKALQELQVKYTKAKSDLKKAKIVIKKEVGDFDNLDNLLKSEGWKGRAQQIELLKSRVNDLKRQVGKKMEETSNISTVRVEGGADERRKEIVSLQEQLAKTKEELEMSKKKAQGYSSRLVALEKEAKEIRETHKVQIKMLLDKTENDDRFIAELKNELERVKKAKGYTRLEPIAGNKEISELKWQIANLHQKLSQVQEELNEKDKMLEMFKNFAEPEGVEDVALKQRVKELETEVKRLKDNEKKGGSSEDGRIIKDLSSQNARMRSKVNELTEELSKLRKN